MWVYYCVENQNKVSRSDLFSKKNLYGMNGENGPKGGIPI